MWNIVQVTIPCSGGSPGIGKNGDDGTNGIPLQTWTFRTRRQRRWVHFIEWFLKLFENSVFFAFLKIIILTNLIVEAAATQVLAASCLWLQTPIWEPAIRWTISKPTSGDSREWHRTDVWQRQTSSRRGRLNRTSTWLTAMLQLSVNHFCPEQVSHCNRSIISSKFFLIFAKYIWAFNLGILHESGLNGIPNLLHLSQNVGQ